MVEAKRSLSRTKPRDYRPQLYALAKYYAKEEAKHRIRAEGKRITDYWPRDIAVMATELLMLEPDRFITRARDVIAKEVEAEQAKERLKAQRKGGHFLSQSVTSPAPSGDQNPRVA
jgi:hypothetical protein